MGLNPVRILFGQLLWGYFEQACHLGTTGTFLFIMYSGFAWCTRVRITFKVHAYMSLHLIFGLHMSNINPWTFKSNASDSVTR